ncbi:MAG: ATP-binding protein [Pseudomonadota bacterium]
MDTYFATPEKLDPKAIAIEIDIIKNNPVMSGLLQSVGGLLAVVDEHRQLVALNDSFLQMLGIKDPEKALGLRLGEALECVHAHARPAGCGTTKYCATCGAAIAMVTSLGNGQPAERICALSAVKDQVPMDLSLLVRSHPIIINQKRFLLLFIQDITLQQNRSALERTFFHDINNMLGMLLGASELLVDNQPSNLAESIYQASLRLKKEVAIQQCLSRSDSTDYQALWHTYPVDQIANELKLFFSNHPVTTNKKLSFPETIPDLSIKTDISLLLRILCNMIINALEATDEKEPVTLSLEQQKNSFCFHVRNKQVIPDDIVQRIFQRNFSTKDQPGRGLGTFSMKLFGEKILGGKVSFTTSQTDGTMFTYASPL